MRRVLLALATAVALVAALFTITTAPAGAALGLVTDLGVDVDVSDVTPDLDQAVDFTVTATNHSLLVPSGGTLTSTQTGVGSIDSITATDGVNCSQTANSVSCSLPSLAPGASATVTLRVTAAAPGDTQNTSTVTPPVGILDLDQSDNSETASATFGDGGVRLAPDECLQNQGHEICNTGDNDVIVTEFQEEAVGSTPVCNTEPCPALLVDFSKHESVQGVTEVDVEYGVPAPPCRGPGKPCAEPYISKDGGATYQKLSKCATETQTECYVSIYKTEGGVWHIIVRLSTQDPLIPILGFG